MITIQSEKKRDHKKIYEINVLVCGRENEAKLVDSLRKSPRFISGLSLVALKENKVVGYILFTPIAIKAEHCNFHALALAPHSGSSRIPTPGHWF